MIADRGNVNKKQFTKYFDYLSALEVNNIIMFTLPYSHSLPHTENDYRYKINLTMSTLTCNNWNNNKIHIVDCNNLTCNLQNNLYMTKDTFFVSKYYKRQIANSLSYCIQCIAKNLANQPAFIEQKIDMQYQTLECIPSNLN